MGRDKLLMSGELRLARLVGERRVTRWVGVTRWIVGGRGRDGLLGGEGLLGG